MSDGAQSVLITMAEYARRRGVSRKTVTVWAQRGRITTVGTRKLIDPVAADRALATSQQVAAEVGAIIAAGDDASPGGDATAGSNLTVLKAQTEAERGQLLRIERLEREGKLVPRDQVVAEAEIAARRVKQALDTLPSHAEDLAILATAGDVLGVRRALKKFAREVGQSISEAMAAAADEVEAERHRSDSTEADE